MPGPIERVRVVFDVRPGEGAASAWAAIGFFAIMVGYFMLRPLRDAAGIDGNPDFIPWLWTVTFAVMTVIAAPWGALVARVPRRLLVPISFRVLGVMLVGFAGLFAWQDHSLVVGRVFYVWLSVFNLFVVSVFWSVCADLVRPDQGRRLFGPIAVGGTAGAITGSWITREIATDVDAWALVLTAAVLLEGAVWALGRVEHHGRRLTSASAGPALPAADVHRPGGLGGHPLGGLAQIARSPYLAAIAGYVICTACLGTFVYLTQADIAKAALPDRAARTRFFADVELWTQLATIAIQAVLTSRLLRWVGAGAVLAILPVVQSLGMIGLVTAPSLAMATAVSAGGRAATHALSRPARETLFTAVPREDRFKAKNVIDTLIYRFGDFGSSWLHRGLTAAGVALTAVALPLAGVWIGLALALGVGHRRRVGVTAGSGTPDRGSR